MLKKFRILGDFNKMFIVRWLLSHPLLLAWALAILAILLNFGSGSNHAGDDAVHQAENGTEVQAEQQAVEQQQPEAHAESERTQVVAAGEAEEVPAQQMAQESTASAQAQAETAQVAPEQQGAEAVPTENAVDPNVVVAPVAAPQSMPAENLLLMARDAYWKGDYASSVQYYNELIKQVPTDISLKGELANVLWKSGEGKQAAAIYVDIAKPMIDAGQGEQVKNMLQFISAYFPEKAQELAMILNK
jgi:hypothetical protein